MSYFALNAKTLFSWGQTQANTEFVDFKTEACISHLEDGPAATKLASQIQLIYIYEAKAQNDFKVRNL